MDLSFLISSTSIVHKGEKRKKIQTERKEELIETLIKRTFIQMTLPACMSD